MAKVFVKLPVGLVTGGGATMVECEGVTLGDALKACVEKDPRLQSRIFRENGAVWPGVFVNGRNSRQFGGLDARLKDGDMVTIVPPISGG